MEDVPSVTKQLEENPILKKAVRRVDHKYGSLIYSLKPGNYGTRGQRTLARRDVTRDPRPGGSAAGPPGAGWPGSAGPGLRQDGGAL